ncbi:hypothetical protein HanPSC8_Chr16g0724311 [Helianthus annuus]|nr:hypothetical protein HanPSC8_Chr16g0724311 [Helianthus annuus]
MILLLRCSTIQTLQSNNPYFSLILCIPSDQTIRRKRKLHLIAQLQRPFSRSVCNFQRSLLVVLHYQLGQINCTQGVETTLCGFGIANLDSV